MPGAVVPSDRVGTGFDPSTLIELVGDDRAFLVEFVALFKQDAARLAGEIRAAMNLGDGPAVERSAHSLKGMLSHFGESAAFGLAQSLETLGGSLDLSHAELIEFTLLAELALIQQGLDRLVL